MSFRTLSEAEGEGIRYYSLTSMLLTSTLALLALAAIPGKPRSHIPADQLNDIATILAHDEGWPMSDPDYTLDPMHPDTDDGFDSIGIYKKPTSSACTPSTPPPAKSSTSSAAARSSASTTSSRSN
ncbi:hypothetical protein [Tunturiibacter gelidiferens]|uniref:hypothetical protein n=1 Tax=Tunturiibacter gelidiferens TaxID=3069689 RepID=UPI003D9BE421